MKPFGTPESSPKVEFVSQIEFARDTYLRSTAAKVDVEARQPYRGVGAGDCRADFSSMLRTVAWRLISIRRPTTAGETPGSASSNSTARNHFTSAIGEPAITVATRSPVCRRQRAHSQHRRDGSQCPPAELQRGHRQVSHWNRLRKNSSHARSSGKWIWAITSRRACSPVSPGCVNRSSRNAPNAQKTPSRDWPGSA